MADSFYIGQGIKISLEFHDSNGSLIDPAVPNVSVLKPSGVHPTYTYPAAPELVRDSVGKYHLNITVDVAGDWFVRGWATGGITVSSQISFRGLAINA